MKKILIILTIIISAACQKQIAVTNSELTLNNFFERCNSDIKKASGTISSKKLVSALFHLNRMNNGGSHYYILEKEATTEMLNQLSTYKYSECILITNEGKIIYTMYDNSLLGKSIYSIPGKPFDTITEKALRNEPAVSDSVKYAVTGGLSDNLTFAYPVFEDGKQKGVLITSVPTRYLKDELPANTYVVDQTGIIKYHPNHDLYDTIDENFPRRGIDNTVKTKNGRIIYTEMKFENINWFIAAVN
ncbi:MAG: cache domain-containing protein [Spirochaetes bacterium]|nr:cache domain-containing protein [Spirochaetota bacterium]